MNSRYTLSDVPIAKAKSIIFSILSSEEIIKNSVVSIENNDMFDKGIPKPNGLYDLRMGTIDKYQKCQTCNSDIINCQGHFGHIQLAYPIYNICYVKIIHKILQCICMRCSNVLVDIPNLLRRNKPLRLKLILDKIYRIK